MMSTFKLLKQTNREYLIKGDLTFFTINDKSAQLLHLSKSRDEICVDLSQVNSTDSAGLALIVEWIKLAKQADTRLVYKNTPQQLLTLSQLCGFEYEHIFV